MWAQSFDTVRIATFAAPLSRDGPGLLLRDIARGEDPAITAIIAVIDHVEPDILLLTDIDFDVGGAALFAFSEALGKPYAYQFTSAPNTGVQTGADMDGDGFFDDASDALGHGRFFGDGGMAVLSRYPIDTQGVVDHTSLRWRDVPDSVLPMVDGAPFPSEAVQSMMPVSSAAHWSVPVDVGAGGVTLLAYAATAPIFDGPEDMNGLRNRDELRVWEAVLNGDLGPAPHNPILIGNVNADPFDGQGIRSGIAGVLARDDLQDPRPGSEGARLAADPAHSGDPALDTADWSDDGPGNLRVSYVLPSHDMAVAGAGVFWPTPDDPLAALLGGDGLAAGAHRLVWVDIEIESLR